MGFSKQEHWSGLPCPAPGDLPGPGITPVSFALAGRFFTTGAPWEAPLVWLLARKLTLSSKCDFLFLSLFLLRKSVYQHVTKEAVTYSEAPVGPVSG